MSTSDIEIGTRWDLEISGELAESTFGVICLTPENLSAPWMLFEAGAIAKSIANTHVCPYLYDLEPLQIVGPLALFQGSKSDHDGTWSLIRTLNNTMKETGLQENRAKESFANWWPQLMQILSEISATHSLDSPRRSDREILEEILETTRTVLRQPNRLLLRRDAAFDQILHNLPASHMRIIQLALMGMNSEGLQQEFGLEPHVLDQAKHRIISRFGARDWDGVLIIARHLRAFTTDTLES
jgi:hypothetical protein